MEQVTVATEVIEQSPGTYSARINGGNVQSGFCRHGNDQHGRGYAAIMVEVQNGNYVPYVEVEPTPIELLEQSDMEFIKSCARMLEDIAAEREAERVVNPAYLQR